MIKCEVFSEFGDDEDETTNPLDMTRHSFTVSGDEPFWVSFVTSTGGQFPVAFVYQGVMPEDPEEQEYCEPIGEYDGLTVSGSWIWNGEETIFLDDIDSEE